MKTLPFWKGRFSFWGVELEPEFCLFAGNISRQVAKFHAKEQRERKECTRKSLWLFANFASLRAINFTVKRDENLKNTHRNSFASLKPVPHNTL
jgi:hypothetical protein